MSYMVYPAVTVGAVYGRLTVIDDDPSLHRLRPSGKAERMYRCRCSCGAVVLRLGEKLRNGRAISCGCARNDHCRAIAKARRTHAATGSPTYITWVSMRHRCYMPKHDAYPHYGGRGISVCQRWLGRGGFANFLTDMGERPSRAHTIDRINPNGNYEPSNCRWATTSEQGRNRSSTKLDPPTVLALRSASPDEVERIAAERGVNVQYARSIRTGSARRWKDVTD